MNNNEVNAQSVANEEHNETTCSYNFLYENYEAVCDKCYNEIVETITEDYPEEMKVTLRK